MLELSISAQGVMQMARMQTYGHRAQQVIKMLSQRASVALVLSTDSGVCLLAFESQLYHLKFLQLASVLTSFCLSFLIYKKKVIVINYPYVIYMQLLAYRKYLVTRTSLVHLQRLGGEFKLLSSKWVNRTVAAFQREAATS